MTREETIAESIRVEQETGYDSVPTIERGYKRTDSGTICCCFPGCFFTRADPVAMWRHVHGPHHKR